MTNRSTLPLAALLLAISALLGACASGGPASEHSYLLPAAGEPAASDRLPRVRVEIALAEHVAIDGVVPALVG